MSRLLGTHVLEYGKARHRRALRIVGVVLAVATICAIRVYRDDAISFYSRFRLLIAQRSCLAFEPASDQVAGVSVASFDTFCRYWDDSWSREYRGKKLAFLGRRVTPDGKALMLVLEGELLSRDTWAGVRQQFPHVSQLEKDRRDFPVTHHAIVGPGLIIDPGSWTRSPEVIKYTDGDVLFLGVGDKAVMYMGKADDKDLSHFIIPYVLNGEHGIVDGWLRDSNTIEFKVRTTKNGE